MSLMDRIAAHLANESGSIVEIPEWAEPGEPPVRIRVKPQTIGARRVILKMHADDSTGVDATVRTIIRSCVYADSGEQVFKESEHAALKKHCHPAIMNRISKAIDELNDEGGKEPVDEAEKN